MAPKGWLASPAARQMAAASSSLIYAVALGAGGRVGGSANGLLGTVPRAQGEPI
jgi:hypothetical protein